MKMNKKSVPCRFRAFLTVSMACCVFFLSPVAYGLAALPDAGPSSGAETAEAGDPGASYAQPPRPEVILSSYRVTEGSLIAGENITIQMTFENTSRVSSVRDLLITYNTGKDTIYTIYGEANTSMVDEIAPGGKYQLEKRFILPRSAPEITPLEISLRYQSGGMTTVNSLTAIYLPVFASNSIVSKIDVPGTVYPNAPVMISGYCTNMSSYSLRDLTMRIEGDIEEEIADRNLGDIEKGGQVAVQEFVRFQDAGYEKQVSVTFSFSDSQGNRITLFPQRYSVNVLEPLPGEDVSAPYSFSSRLLDQIYRYTGLRVSMEILLYAILALCVVIGVTLVLIRNRRRNKRL